MKISTGKTLTHCRMRGNIKEKRKASVDVLSSYELKEIRKSLGLSQAEFSQMINVPLRTIEDWERGVRTPPEYVTKLIIREIDRKALEQRKKLTL